jgi:hypothetical protein
VQLWKVFEEWISVCQTLPAIFELPQYLALSSKYDPLGLLLVQVCTEDTNNYYRLMVILNTNDCSTVEGDSTIDDYLTYPFISI